MLTAIDDHTVFLQATGINSIIRNAETITFDAPGTGTDHSVDVAAFVNEYAPRQLSGTEASDTLYGGKRQRCNLRERRRRHHLYWRWRRLCRGRLGQRCRPRRKRWRRPLWRHRHGYRHLRWSSVSYTLSIYDDITVQIDGPDSVTWIADGEWLIFDDPNSDVDEVVNIDDFLNGGSGSGAQESNVVALNVDLATSGPSSVDPAPSLPDVSANAFAPSAEVIAFPTLNVTSPEASSQS